MDNERIEERKRCAKMYWSSRAEAGVSQEYMALALGVSKNTVGNWERGTSSPTIFQSAEWFRVLGLNPFLYFLEYYHPETFDNIEKSDDDAEILKSLHEFIDLLPPKMHKQLAYVMYGKHGSPIQSLLQMFTAHCHTSMQSRVGVADLILRNYEMDKATGKLVSEDTALPDIDLLKESIELGHEAVMNSTNGYTTAPIKKEPTP